MQTALLALSGQRKGKRRKVELGSKVVTPFFFEGYVRVWLFS
jgi:hypothetical protein